jgi:Icc-related predicted phosphoesterase
VCPGNDDKLGIDKVFGESDAVINCEGRVEQIDGQHELIGCGWTNPSPWDLYREEPEEQLLKRLESYMSQVKDVSSCVCNFHDPPFQSGLDEAQMLTGSVEKNDLKPIYGQTKAVGSTAVRSIIEKHQPLIGLFGHIHEGRGMTTIGRTSCFNPGSSYEQGVLLGVVINVEEKDVKNYLSVFG